MQFTWRRCSYYEMKELYELVIPECDRWVGDKFLDTDIIKGFIAEENGEVIACSVICNLEISETMYIDCFAISPSIRGKKLSYIAWNTFIEFINNNYPEINTDRLIIEVYLQNIELWGKIMGIESLNMTNAINLKSDVLIMGKNIHNPNVIYEEWKNIADENLSELSFLNVKL